MPAVIHQLSHAASDPFKQFGRNKMWFSCTIDSKSARIKTGRTPKATHWLVLASDPEIFALELFSFIDLRSTWEGHLMIKRKG